MPCLSETRWFLQSSSFWEARLVLIGQLSSALWLAENLKLRRKCYAPHRIEMPWRHKHNKTHYKLGICCIHWGNITDYNDLYCLLNITMSAFVIRETTNNKHYSTLLKTQVWIVSSRNIFTDCESEAPDCPCKVGSAPFYRNSLCERQHCRLLVQVQGIVLHKMRCTHSNIWF